VEVAGELAGGAYNSVAILKRKTLKTGVINDVEYGEIKPIR